MKKTIFFNGGRTEHLFMPGVNLSEFELQKLYQNLVDFNIESGNNVKNNMLKPGLKSHEIKKYFDNCVVGLLYLKDKLEGFLVSPLLHHDNKSILHLGLLIINKNPGSNILGLIGAQNTLMAFRELGEIYLTNITSTPSAVQCFDFYCPGSWPSPSANLKKRPYEFERVVRSLKEKYIDLYFPNSNEIKINYKKFIMQSNSLEMGFKTNFYQMPCAPDFKYNSFCQSWINYENQEDLIQVCSFNLMKYLRLEVIQAFLILNIKLKARKELSSRDLEFDEVSHDEKAAA